MDISHKIVTKPTRWASSHPQGEIKINKPMCQVSIVVAVDGWNYRDHYGDCHNPTQRGWGDADDPKNKSYGKQVRISMNGPLMLTLSEWNEITSYVDNVCQEVLEEYNRRGL